MSTDNVTVTIKPSIQCVQIGCTEPSTCTLTVLVGYDPEIGAIPGNGRLVYLRFCADCAEAEKQELLLAASDNAEFVTCIPDQI